MIFTIFVYEFIILLFTSMISILLFVVFDELVIYDYRGYNCYSKNTLGKIDKLKWKYIFYQ